MVRRVGRFVKRNKEAFIVWGVIVVLGGGVYLFWPSPPSPVPASIQKAVDFKVVYPTKTVQADPTSWKYQASEQILTFNVKTPSYSAVISEQEVPIEYIDDEAAYDRFIGSLKPYANFNVPLGSVSLVNFVTAGDFLPTGPAAVLKTKDTLIIAHPNGQLSENDWFNLFESLKIGD